MTTMRLTSASILFLALIAVLGTSTPAQAEIVFQATMLPDYVVPASAADAYGMATLVVADDWSQAAYTLNFAGLESPETGAVLFHAAAGETGPSLMTLPLGSPLAGTFAITPEMHDALDNAALAIQVAEENYPDGCIRGNFTFVVVPTEPTSWGSVKTLFQ